MRRFTAYELNILNRFKINPESIKEDKMPVEYIVKKGEFCERFFELSQATLIPRVETEYLIELGLKFVSKKFITFADIGCGSGAIGISFGIEITKRNISFAGYLSDISNEALNITKDNVKNFEYELDSNRMRIIKSNLLKSYYIEVKLDLIFANLPYIPSARISQLDESVLKFEPITALDGGEDGLKYIRELLNSARHYLNSNGIVLFEVDDSHSNISEFKNDWNIEVKNDFNGKIRYWICKAR